MREEQIEKRFLSVKDLAEYLSIKEQSIYNRLAKKAKYPFPIRPVRRDRSSPWGKSLRFDIKDVNRYIESQKTVSTQPSELKKSPLISEQLERDG